MATYNSNKKSSVQLDTNRKRYALVAGNGVAVLMSDEHKFRRFSSNSKNAILNSLEALEYILAKCPTNETVSELVIDIGIPNCIKGVFGASFRQYIRTQKFVGSGEIIPINMLDKMKAVVKMYNDRNFNVNIYSLSMASVDEEMTKIKQRALDILYKVQVEDSQSQPAQQPVTGFTQEQVNAMIQQAVAQALSGIMGNQSQPVQQPVQQQEEPIVEQSAQQPVPQAVSESDITEEECDFDTSDFTDNASDDFTADDFGDDMEQIPF